MTPPAPPPNPSVFLSYAREDDEPFVRRLYDDLVAAGFTVWFDRVSMPSRGLPFHQEIRDAIASIDRLVLVVGPKALTSDYVTQEWQFAHFAVNKPVVPIVRLDGQGPAGDSRNAYELLPEDIRLLHAEDFRRDAEYRRHFELLVNKLREPLPPVGKLVAVPELPPTYRAQPDRLKALRDMLLLDLQGPVVVTGARARVGVSGMGGIGKSVLANAVAHDPWVQRAFGDNIYWIRFGQAPNVEEQQRWLARELGDAGEFQGVEPGKERLRTLLADRAILLILDNVWERASADAFNVIGPRGRILLTTRDADLVTALADRGTQYRVELPTEMEAIALLATAAEADPAALPAEAQEIVTRTGRLPLALALCGGMVRGEEGIAWRDVRDALRDHDLEFLSAHHSSEEQHQNAWVAMDVSLRVLLPAQQQRFAELAVFLQGRQVPEAAVATLWGHTAQLAPRHAAKLLADFARRSLVQKVRTRDGASALITLHDLLYLFAEGILERRDGSLKAGQRILLDAYRAVCPAGWASGPDDGYFLQTLVEHLIAAERSEEACALLDGLRWIEARCKAGQAFALLDDYARVLETIPEERERREADRRQEARLTRWGEELASYARAWSDRRDREATGAVVTRPLPLLPDAPGLCRMETDAEIDEADQRVIEEPTQLDRLRQFGGFVRAEVHPLDRFGGREAFVAQHALGRHPSGAPHSSAQMVMGGKMSPWLERRWPTGSSTSSRPALLATLEGHTDWVESVSVTPDGRRAVSGSDDRTLRVWDLASGACLHTLEGHTGEVMSVSVTPDGRRAVSGSDDRTLRVWDLASGACLHTLQGHTASVMSVSVTPDGRRAVSGSWDKTLRVWDLASGACLHTLEGHTDIVLSVSVTPDGRRAVSGSGNRTLRVWDLASGARLHTLEGHTGIVMSVSVTPDGRRAVSGSGDRTLRVWDLASGARLHTLEGHTDSVMSVSVTPDGRRAVSGSLDNALRVWDLASGACLRTLEGHTHGVASVSVTPDGRRAVSGSRDNTLRVWDLASGARLRTLEGHAAGGSVSVTPDGRRAVSGSGDNALRVWDLASGACLRTLEGHTASVMSVSVTPDGRRAVSGSRDNTLRVWDLASGACLRTLEGHTDWVVSVSVTPDGRRAVSGSWDTTLRVWDLASGACLRTLEGHTLRVGSVSVTPDGRRAVSGSWDTTLRVWDLASGACLRTLEGHAAQVESVSVTPDGRRAVSGSWDTTLRVWDLASGACLRTLEGHTGGLARVRVSVTPDGRRAVSGSWDTTLRVWDLASGACLHTLEGHTGRVESVSVTPDGRRAVSGSWNDATLRVWDLASGELVSPYAAAAPVFSCALHGRTICADLVTGEVIFLDLQGPESAASLLTASCDASARCALCGEMFKAPQVVLPTIGSLNEQLTPDQSPCLNLPASAFDDPRLQSKCPKCEAPVTFNPFLVDTSRDE